MLVLVCVFLVNLNRVLRVLMVEWCVWLVFMWME